MEPLAAVGLAANILQFVELCAKVVSEGNQIYHSVNGTTEEYTSLEQMCESIKELSDGLVPPQLQQDFSTLPPEKRPSKMEMKLAQLALRCRESSDQLLQDLRNSRLDSTDRGRAASLRQSIRNVMGRSRLKVLQTTVERHRTDLMLFKFVQELRGAGLNLVHDHARRTFEISRLVKDIHNEATKFLRNDGESSIHIASISQKLADLSASSARNYIVEHAIVESLDYESKSYRYESIPDAHKETFNWVLSQIPKNSTIEHPECSLLDWLWTGDGLYWVSGKPGSGKSTLMKFVADHHITREALGAWAGHNTCMVASYYFWIAGTHLQKTIEGLLRSLLFDIFAQHPRLIPIAAPDLWESMTRPWAVQNMSNALERLASHDNDAVRFCLFIDGLDEYDGDHRQIVRMLKHLSQHPNFKLCVSSRPWNVFEDGLGLDPKKKLYTHELTRNDIQKYIASTLGESPHWPSGPTIDP
ncbi:hypothetical protein VTJ49DRAFT_493 [Mycothermus thermophilus]|uniref:Nephrocystin 3-like N-terminal domain-containing protein n=1 Tax=Humicola insolens TaxID=85995 RepID=A0ABR3VF00_HUMIN